MATDRRVTPDAAIRRERLVSVAREHCEICGEPYAVWFAPSDVWNMVMRSSSVETDWFAFVCPRCFTLEAEHELEGITGWLVTPCNEGPVRSASQVVIRDAS